VTAATGASVTVIEDVPVFVSLVAAIVTGPPAATPVTKPVVLTVATVLLSDDHVTVRSASTLSAASRNVAVSCCVAPTAKLAEAGFTVTVFTGARSTMIDDPPVLVSLVAVIVVPPAPTAVTRPFASTVAAAGLLELHVMRRPVSVFPLASLVTAVSC
jgi:hypothetical protein